MIYIKSVKRKVVLILKNFFQNCLACLSQMNYSVTLSALQKKHYQCSPASYHHSQIRASRPDSGSETVTASFRSSARSPDTAPFSAVLSNKAQWRMYADVCRLCHQSHWNAPHVIQTSAYRYSVPYVVKKMFFLPSY